MAETLVSLEEICRELEMSQQQVLNLVKQGLLRGFRDGQTYKFRRADIEAYKKQAQESATVVYDESQGKDTSDSDVTDVAAGQKKGDTSKIDLAEIEAEPGADESDQTSVLAPVEESEEESREEEKPQFDFAEEEVGLSMEEEPEEAEEAEQTAVLTPVDATEEGAGKDEKAEFDFSEEEPGESVLVADESESSSDILETAEESSSESVTTDSDLALVEESAEEAPVVADEPAEVILTPEEAAETATAETVSDILGSAEEVSDDALETLDIEEVMGTQGTPVEAPVGAPPTETAATVPVGDEVETVGIAAEPTQGVEGAFVEAVEAEGMMAPAAAVRPGWELVVPGPLGNAFLILTVVMFVLAGVFILSEMSGTTNVITEEIGRLLAPYF